MLSEFAQSVKFPDALSRNRRHFRLGWKELHVEGLCLVFKPFEALEAELISYSAIPFSTYWRP